MKALSTRTPAAALATAGSLVLGSWLAACGSKGAPATTAGTAGSSTGAGGKASGATYEKSACGTCVATQCATEIDTCTGDPGCAGFLACLDACPLASGGDAEASCVSACAVGSSTTTQQDVAAVNACRAEGPGATSCAACGHTTMAKYTAPALNDTCPSMAMDVNACAVCIDEHCCQAYMTCHTDADCHAYQQCVDGCQGDGGAGSKAPCFKACSDQHPEGANTFGPYEACGAVLCGTACSPTPLDACEQCMWGTCGDTYAYWLSAPGGVALSNCIDTCAIDDTACDQTCYAAYPEAFSKYADDAACIGVACKTACNL